MKQFEWSRLGDVGVGRENLGDAMPVVVYRLMQFTMMDTLTEKFGTEEAENIFREAGYEAGKAFALNVLKSGQTFDAFIANLKEELSNLKIGVLRIEKSDMEQLAFTLTVSEDLDCSGLPVSGVTVCAYDEGFISGILEHQTNIPFVVEEIDCWATGARTCRFEAKAKR